MHSVLAPSRSLCGTEFMSCISPAVPAIPATLPTNSGKCLTEVLGQQCVPDFVVDRLGLRALKCVDDANDCILSRTDCGSNGGG